MINNQKRLKRNFFEQDVLEVAPSLLGKKIVRAFPGNITERYIISEVEAYKGEEDKACHVSKGKTNRTSVMYEQGGLVYVYLIYGMYWMLNFVTGKKDYPQAVLIRGLISCNGPGRLTRLMKIDKGFYGEDLCDSSRIWVENVDDEVEILTGKRIGVDYAGEYWKNKPWRFILKNT